MQIDEIQNGDTVRLRNGETIVVRSKATAIHDRDGEHEGPFLLAGRGFDHYALADVLEVVARNERLCRYCGEGVTSSNPETDFCEGCHYTGRALTEKHADLIGRLGDIDEVKSVDVWHTGGGCFLLAVTFADDSLATMDSELAIPEGDEPWTLIVVAPDYDAWGDWDEERLDVRVGEWTTDQLVLEVEQIAKDRSGVIDLAGERQYREELRTGRDPRD